MKRYGMMGMKGVIVLIWMTCGLAAAFGAGVRQREVDTAVAAAPPDGASGDVVVADEPPADSAGDRRIRLHAVGRAKTDGNLLRWAPETFGQWEVLLRHGVVVERHRHVGDTVLSDIWRRPALSASDSLAFVTGGAADAWTAAMGELLFADSLEIGPGGGRFSRLSQEREQRQMRFAMALLVGDRSYAAACAGLLGWRDTLGAEAFPYGNTAAGGRTGKPASDAVDAASTVSAYLYRIYVPDVPCDTAVVLLRPQDGLLLPPRTLLSAEFGEETATLRWDSRLWEELCVGYYVERAVGNGAYETRNAHPIDVLQRDRAGAEELLYVDSLPGRRKVRYRVVGVDLFGDRYPVTGEAEGEAEATGLSAPQIERVTDVARGGVELRWRYPATQEKALARFEVFVKDSMYGAYRSLGTVTPKTRRLAVPASRLRPSSYFCVAACNRREEVCYSPVYFYQRKDTTPPLPPVSVTAYADTGGGVHLSWRPSPSGDAVGYLVLKGRRLEDGLPWQVHAEPIADTVYTDSIDALLWQAAYYYVAAVDPAGNISDLSAPVTVLPNRPNPMAPPLFDGCETSEKRLKLRWFNSMDAYASTCALYVSVDGGEPQLVTRRRLSADRPVADSLWYALPSGRALATHYRFTLSVESPSGDTVWAPTPYAFLQEPVLSAPRLQAWAEREKRCVAVQWQAPPYAPVAKAYLYRRAGDGPYRLLAVLTASELADELYVDRAVSMNTAYAYRIQFETTDGRYTPFGTVGVTY